MCEADIESGPVYLQRHLESRRQSCRPASGCAHVDQDVMALIRWGNALLAGLLVQLEGPVHVTQALASHQQAPIRHLRRLHTLCLHLLKHLHSSINCCKVGMSTVYLVGKLLKLHVTGWQQMFSK